MGKIPREEVREIEAVLLACRDELVNDAASTSSPAELLVSICGSYRRGKHECGDVDVLISSPGFLSDTSHPKAKLKAGGELLHAFVVALRRAGLLTDDLASGSTKYMGVCKLPGPGRLHRRLDVRCIPYDQYFFGLLYFTGPRSLSIEMRQAAIERGFVLNEYGLTKHGNPSERTKVHSEREIFDALGVLYREPTER